MGGATDATNVASPDGQACAAITAVGLEHRDALGGTLESIARAKAGIARPGRPLVIGRQVTTCLYCAPNYKIHWF